METSLTSPLHVVDQNSVEKHYLLPEGIQFIVLKAAP